MSVNIHVMAFGISKDIVGKASFELTVRKNSSVRDIKALLIKTYPGLKKLPALMIAVNAKYAHDNDTVKSNDKIALIPPTNGG